MKYISPIYDTTTAIALSNNSSEFIFPDMIWTATKSKLRKSYIWPVRVDVSVYLHTLGLFRPNGQAAWACVRPLVILRPTKTTVGAGDTDNADNFAHFLQRLFIVFWDSHRVIW
jgi:hypothetical protein